MENELLRLNDRLHLPTWCTTDERVPTGSDILNRPLIFDKATVLIGVENEAEYALEALKAEACRIAALIIEPKKVVRSCR